MIHVVIGTRAQLLKMAPIMMELKRRKTPFRWIYTAQHRDTMDELLKEFGLSKPDYTVIQWSTEANTMVKIWRWFFSMIGKLVFNRKKILGGYTGQENLILTHGDTVTTWWGALLGKLSGCKVMHIESGLRSFNIFEPFPEEINRLITFSLTDYYACPGKWAMTNLKNYKGQKFDTGMNTQIDTLNFGIENVKKSKIKLPFKEYVVVSLHRYENIFKKERFRKIIEILDELSSKVNLVMVLHPATKIRLEKFGYRDRFEKNPHIKFLPRLDHLSFIKLILNSEFVITDGGGNQEELYHIGKPTLLFREATERQEGIGKTALLSGLDRDKIFGFLKTYKKYRQSRIKIKHSPSKIIVDKIINLGY